MGRTTKKNIKKEQQGQKQCSCCLITKNVDQFYASTNKLDSFGRVGICKVCIKKNVDTNDLTSVQNILTQLNKPFLYSQWISAMDEAKSRNRDIFGIYLKTIFFNYKDLTWKDSVFEKTNKDSVSEDNSNNNGSLKKSEDFKFNITAEIITRWGSNYDKDSYIKLEDFYHKMKLSNRIETPQEETYLKKLAVISLKMDKELDAGNYGQVKQLGDLFSKYMADSKFRAMDKSEADKTGGIRNFGTIYSEVEKDGNIPPWEYYRKIKGLTQDIVDKTIMHIENFTLRLNKIERMVEPPKDTPKLVEDDES